MTSSREPTSSEIFASDKYQPSICPKNAKVGDVSPPSESGAGQSKGAGDVTASIISLQKSILDAGTHVVIPFSPTL